MAVVMGTVLVLATVGGAIATLTTDSPTDPATTTSAAPVVDAEGEQLLDLLRTGLGGTFHAEYTITQASGAAAASLTVDHDAGRIRDLLATPTADGVDLNTTIFDGDAAASCSQPAGGAWTCRPADPAAPRADALFRQVDRSDLEGVDVTAAPTQLAGRDGTCFSFAGPDGPTSVCLDPAGVPLSFTVTSLDIQLTALDPAVDPAAFALPAAVTQ
jgi:hypothetical protein